MPRFLHIADPHIDSSMKALQPYPGAPDFDIESATRKAFENAVDLAIRETVDLVVIAGDLFDGDWRDAGTYRWTLGQMQRLVDENTPVVLIRGNHDAASQIQADMRWPVGVHELSHEAAETVSFENLGFAVHGHSYAARDVFDDLAAGYPAPVPGLFNIGLLHTGLEGNAAHKCYAPTSPEALVARGYDYWALGHIHQPTPSADYSRFTVPVVFAGNPQGRDVGECGPRGAVLVDVEGGAARPKFVPLDVVRWFNTSVTPGEGDNFDGLIGRVADRLADHRGGADGRLIAVRVEVTGPFSDHAAVNGTAGRAVFESAVREAASKLGNVWVESVRVSTAPPLDLEKIEREGGLIGDVLGAFREALAEAGDEDTAPPADGRLFADEPTPSAWLDEALAPVETHTGALAPFGMNVELQNVPPEDRVRWLRAARSHLVAALSEESA